MAIDLVATLADLVALPSVNPMGGPHAGDHFFEHRVTEYLERLFAGLSVPCERQAVAPQRENIIARLDGSDEVWLWEAHQDTVPAEGMTIDPWKPVQREGRLYGRGACDIKGGMAAMLAAFARLADERPATTPTILMACTVNEEHGYSGAKAMAQRWRESGDSIFPRRPDVAIVAEPTDLHVVAAHKGAVRWRCRTLGRAAHSSRPERGENAIYHMAPVITALKEHHQELADGTAGHPLCGGPTLSVGTIHGGLSVNTVPDRCEIEIDRRLAPGESPEAARDAVIEHLAHSTPPETRIEHDAPFLVGWPLMDEANTDLARRLSASVKSIAAERGDVVGAPYGTNAATFARAGVPSVVFGPGSISQAHTADEWIALDELAAAAEILYRFAGGRS